MGATHRFLALGDDLKRVYDWFDALPEPPHIVQGRGCQFLHFAACGGLAYVPGTRDIAVANSPIASLLPPERIAEVLWTAGELHILATPLRERFPQLDAVNHRFARWLHRFERVFDRPGKSGEWDFFLEGNLRNYDLPIYALPEAIDALRAGQYFVEHGMSGDGLNRLLRTLELRGVPGARPRAGA
jgi:hypothetical protein